MVKFKKEIFQKIWSYRSKRNVESAIIIDTLLFCGTWIPGGEIKQTWVQWWLGEHGDNGEGESVCLKKAYLAVTGELMGENSRHFARLFVHLYMSGAVGLVEVWLKIFCVLEFWCRSRARLGLVCYEGGVSGHWRLLECRWDVLAPGMILK